MRQRGSHADISAFMQKMKFPHWALKERTQEDTSRKTKHEQLPVECQIHFCVQQYDSPLIIFD